MNPVMRIAKERKIRPRDVAKATGFPQSTISEWLNGKYYPTVERLPKLAEAMGVDVIDLIPKEEPWQNGRQ